MIIALDLGTKCGFAYYTGKKICSGTKNFTPSRWDAPGERFKRFTDFLDEIQERAGPLGVKKIYFEAVERHIGTYAHHIYGAFWGHLLSWGVKHNVECQGVPVGAIKKHITGKGNADKLAVIKAVQAKGFNPKDDNEADALALLDYCLKLDR